MSHEAKTQEQPLSEGAGQQTKTSSDKGVAKKEEYKPAVFRNSFGYIGRKLFLEGIKQLENTFIAEPVPITIDKLHTVYKRTDKSPSVSRPQYNILLCRNINDIYKPNRLILRTELSRNEKMSKVFMSRVSTKKAEKWSEFKEIKGVAQENAYPTAELYKEIDACDNKKILEVFSKNKDFWSEMMNFLADDTNTKDRRFIDIAMASMLPIPLSMRHLQRLNSHFMLFTNGGTGKTKVFRYLAGVIPTTDYSEAGLLGSYSKEEGLSLPKLQGTQTPYIFSEVTGKLKTQIQKTEKIPVAELLLDYMEDGIGKRDIYSGRQNISCEGTKTIGFIGNTDSLEDCINILGALIYLKNGDKLGRRIKQILIDPFANPCEEVIENGLLALKEEKLDTLQYIISLLIRKGEPKYCKFITKNLWLCKKDEEFIKQAMDSASRTQNNLIFDLVKGHSLTTPSINFAALKIYIMSHLPEIVSGKILKVDRKEFEDIYCRQTKMNLDSINIITGGDKRMEEFLKYIQENNISITSDSREIHSHMEELQKVLGLKERQVYNVINKYKRMKIGIERTSWRH